MAQKTAAANAEVAKRLVEANKRLSTIDADVARQRDSGRKALAAAVQNTVAAVEKAKVRIVVLMVFLLGFATSPSSLFLFFAG